VLCFDDEPQRAPSTISLYGCRIFPGHTLLVASVLAVFWLIVPVNL